MVYCEAKRILIAYENKQGSIQSLITQSQCKYKNSLTCLIMKTISYKKLLNKIIKKSKLLENENFLGDKLAQLLVYDVLFGMGVRGKFKGTMKRNFDKLNDACEHYMKKYAVDSRDGLLKLFDTINQSPESNTTTSTSTKPKYIFMNRLALSKKDILSKLNENSYELVKYDSEENEEPDTTNMNIRFKKFIDNLSEHQFVKDDHIKNLYVFKYNSNLNKTNVLFNEGHLLQIDKASCLVPLALNPPPESHVIDGASAPGNKTILLANILNNSGLIHAFDIEEQRVKLMQENLKQHHVKNVRLRCQDFLATEIEKYDRVEYVMLDVPCSGSGMVSRLKYGDLDVELKKDDKRLQQLQGLQKRMLMHAMKFRSVKRIVYSTCSIHPEENEYVVKYALKNCGRKFKLLNLFADKCNYGRGVCTTDKDKFVYHMERCVRMSYEDNFTNGFFIACFEYNDEEYEKEVVVTALENNEEMNCEPVNP